MGRPLITKRYPFYYVDILNVLRDHPEKPFVLPFPTKAAAMQFSVNWHSFRNAAMNEKWDQYGSVMYYPDLNGITTKRRELHDGTFQIEIWNMDHTPEAIAIKAAIEKANSQS